MTMPDPTGYSKRGVREGKKENEGSGNGLNTAKNKRENNGGRPQKGYKTPNVEVPP